MRDIEFGEQHKYDHAVLTQFIFRAKRAIHTWPSLYQLVFGLLTFNFDYCRQQLNGSAYPSRFGGMWTDHRNFADKLDKKVTSGAIDSTMSTLLEKWHEDGYAELPGAIDDELIHAYLQEIATLKAQSPSPLLVTATSLKDPIPFTAEIEAQETSVRTVDDYFFSEASRHILMHPTTTRFLREIFEAPPLLNQSLSFYHGSQQAVHQDTAFVRMNSPMKLAAIWIALEDVQVGSGELVYYPGSHRWEGFLFSGRFKHWDEERDGLEQLEHWHQWIHEEAKLRQVSLRSFTPKKGDVFVWHAALAHGGAPVVDNSLSRRSLVGHYCPQNVRPLYHYYKPGQRAYHHFQGSRYCSSYYTAG